jgi:hypothetical protein
MIGRETPKGKWIAGKSDSNRLGGPPPRAVEVAAAARRSPVPARKTHDPWSAILPVIPQGTLDKKASTLPDFLIRYGSDEDSR